jgi:hypothetical protein
MLDDRMRLLSRSPWVDRASSYGIVVASATASLGLAGPVWAYQVSDFTAGHPPGKKTELHCVEEDCARCFLMSNDSSQIGLFDLSGLTEM